MLIDVEIPIMEEKAFMGFQFLATRFNPFKITCTDTHRSRKSRGVENDDSEPEKNRNQLAICSIRLVRV